MNNLNGESITADILTDAGGYSTHFASYGIVYTIKDAQGNTVTDNFQAGEWYTIEMTGYDGGARTLDATGGNGDNWRLCTLGTGTGGLDAYVRNVEIITTPIA